MRQEITATSIRGARDGHFGSAFGFRLVVRVRETLGIFKSEIFTRRRFRRVAKMGPEQRNGATFRLVKGRPRAPRPERYSGRAAGRLYDYIRVLSNHHTVCSCSPRNGAVFSFPFHHCNGNSIEFSTSQSIINTDVRKLPFEEKKIENYLTTTHVCILGMLLLNSIYHHLISSPSQM